MATVILIPTIPELMHGGHDRHTHIYYNLSYLSFFHFPLLIQDALLLGKYSEDHYKLINIHFY